MWHPWLGTVGTQTFAPGAAELGLGCAQNCLGTARGPGPAEATQRELYLHAKRVVHDSEFHPWRDFFPPETRFAELRSETRDHNKSISSPEHTVQSVIPHFTKG